MQTFTPNLFIPAMLIGTIGLHHLRTLSLTFTLAREYMVSANETRE